MSGQILVPLKRHDRIEGIIPYLEEVGEPGMKVVFLIPYPVESWLYLKDHWVTTESAREAMLAGRRLMEKYSWGVQKGLAEQKVSLAREVFHRMGVEVAVDLYTGSLRKVVADYAANRDVHLIVVRAGSDHPLIRLLRRMILAPWSFKRPSSPAVLFLHPH